MAQEPQFAVRAVVFDAVGTLIYPDPKVSKVYFEFGQRFGSRRTMDEIKVRFRDAFVQTRNDCANNVSEQSERNRWRQIVSRVFDDLPSDQEDLFKALWRHFADPQRWRLHDDVRAVFSLLRRRGIPIVIASNFDSRLHPIVQSIDVFNNVREVFVSSEVGFAKPHEGFYHSIAGALDIEPTALLMVGDDFCNDFEAATDAGWHALHIDRSLVDSRVSSASCPAPANRTITSLNNVPALLAK